MAIRGTSAICFAFIYVVGASLAWAVPATSSQAPLRFGPRIAAPLGFVALCVRDSRACRPVRASGVATLASGAVAPSQVRMAELAAVDRAVDRAIRPRPDRNRNGLDDRWEIGAREGDCEDYALEKRQRLIAAGWPSSALLIAVGRIADGRQHAVLLARVGDAVHVLDNRRRALVSFDGAGIRWLAIQSPDAPDSWRAP